MKKAVMPFAQAYPAPWRLGRDEVPDADGCHVNGLDGDDPDEVEFWNGIIAAVNEQAATAARASPPTPSGGQPPAGGGAAARTGQ